jgi:protein SCO1
MIPLLRLVAAVLALLLGACGRQWIAPDFRLTDDLGAAWRLADQHGKTVVLTFGFTHCADTCPATITKLTHLAARVHDRGSPLEIVLVTVDPQRDTPAALHRFLARFDGRAAQLTGLTGTPSQIDAVERAYHVWAQRVPGSNRSSYDVAHSAAIYFIDPAGRIRALRGDDDPDAVLSAALREAAS